GLDQRARQAAAALVELAIAVGALAMDHSGLVREYRSCALEEAERRERGVVGGVFLEMLIVQAAHAAPLPSPAVLRYGQRRSRKGQGHDPRCVFRYDL